MKTLCFLLALACTGAGVLPPARAGTPAWELETGRELAVVGGAGAVFALGLLADRSGEPPTDAEIAALDPTSLNWLDRRTAGRWSESADRASDVAAGVLMAAPLVQLGAGPGRDQAGRLALIYGETLLLESAAVFALKGLVARSRPFVYDDDPRVPSALKRSATARRSWPSGHTAHAFAAAVFCGSVFERLQPDSSARGWVWGGCLGMAAATGLLRVEAGRHHPTDVLAGALVGAAAGWLVPRWHEVSGTDGGSGAPMSLAVGFSF